jgi:hypothetical protein
VSIACATPISTIVQRQAAAATVAATRAGQTQVYPNIAVRADFVSTVPMQFLRPWTQGQECVVLDIAGRYAQFDPSTLDRRNIDLTGVYAEELRALLRARYTVSVLGFSHVPVDSRSTAVGMALSAVAAHRARTGRPHWLMIDDAETVLNDPDIPPHALDLSEGGHCLVMRSLDRMPDSLAASIDVVLGRNGWVTADA